MDGNSPVALTWFKDMQSKLLSTGGNGACAVSEKKFPLNVTKCDGHFQGSISSVIDDRERSLFSHIQSH